MLFTLWRRAGRKPAVSDMHYQKSTGCSNTTHCLPEALRLSLWSNNSIDERTENKNPLVTICSLSCHLLVTILSPFVTIWSSCHYCVTTLSPSCHYCVTILSPSCHYCVTILSLSGHHLVTILSPSCHHLVTILSLSCHHLVTISSPFHSRGQGMINVVTIFSPFHSTEDSEQ